MKFFDRLYWIKKEVFSNDTPEQIYDDLSAKGIYESSIKYKKRVENISKVFSQILSDCFNILDLACGTGAVIEALPWKKSAEIVGMDVSENMLKVAKERFRDYPNISFVKGDFMSLFYPPSSFDLITNAYATRFIPAGREEEFAKNIGQVLKPDGRFVAFGDGSVRWLGELLGYIDKKPKNYNFKMNYHRSIVPAFAKYLTLEKRVFIKKIPFFYENTALIFRKAYES